MECKYCNGTIKGIIETEREGGTLKIDMTSAYIFKGFLCTESYIGGESIVANKEINYCPMCGRSLEGGVNLKDRICGNCKYFHHSEADDNGVCGFMRGSYGGGRTQWDSTCRDHKGEEKVNDRIINLVGASGSGKTTLAKELEKKGFNIIQSYTTRKPRESNEWGHIFVFKHVGEVVKEKEKCLGSEVIAFKEVYEGTYYWVTKDQYQGKETSIYIVDPDGAEQVKRNVKDAEVVTILLNADEAVRDYRMGNTRETIDRMQRLIKDREIFKVVKCDYAVDANRDVEEVLTDIVGIIDDQDVY